MNPQQMLPFIGATISIGGIIFQTGKHAEKIDFVFGKVEAQEKKIEYNDKNLCEIKSDLKTLSHDITAIKQDVHDIKKNLNKI
jgi:peptidoglycan hydrolase CwlO-like protein